MKLFSLTHENETFISWWKNPIWLIFKEYFRNKTYLVGLLVFIIYWLVPLLISYFGFTSKPENDLGLEEFLIKYYLTDKTHLYFAIVISIASVIGILSLYKIPWSIKILSSEGVIDNSEQKILEEYNKNRKVANSIITKIVSLIMMVLAGYVFYRFYSLPKFNYWWGNIEFSKANIYFTLVIAAMIYYGTQFTFMFIMNSNLLIKLIKYGLKPRLFHHDGSNGLSPLGTMIILKWLVAICMITGAFIVVFFGYMGLERSLITQLVIAIFTFTIPVIAILPLVKALNQISEIKKEKLKKFGSILNDNLNKIENQVSSNDLENDKAYINNFLEVYQIYTTVNEINVFPFNPKALASVIVIYSFQIALTIYQLF